LVITRLDMRPLGRATPVIVAVRLPPLSLVEQGHPVAAASWRDQSVTRRK
jgi:hypothetical protein